MKKAESEKGRLLRATDKSTKGKLPVVQEVPPAVLEKKPQNEVNNCYQLKR